MDTAQVMITNSISTSYLHRTISTRMYITIIGDLLQWSECIVGRVIRNKGTRVEMDMG